MMMLQVLLLIFFLRRISAFFCGNSILCNGVRWYAGDGLGMVDSYDLHPVRGDVDGRAVF